MNNSTLWDVTVPRLMSSYAVAIFAILWIGFAVALVVNQEWMSTVYQWVQALPIVIRIIVWLVFLPILVGLWIWESSWTTLLQLLAAAGIVGWTLVAINSFIKAWR